MSREEFDVEAARPHARSFGPPAFGRALDEITRLRSLLESARSLLESAQEERELFYVRLQDTRSLLLSVEQERDDFQHISFCAKAQLLRAEEERAKEATWAWDDVRDAEERDRSYDLSPPPEETKERPESREGMVTVYDDQNRYVGCMGREKWKNLLAEGRSERVARREAGT